MNHLPRKGQYELFTQRNLTYCIDDPGLEPVTCSEEMFKWLHDLPADQCRPFSGNVAFYLTPQAYLLWKLRWT